MTSPGPYQPLRDLIAGHEDWLMQRILDYAKQRGYTRYTSTLAEAWRASICGLSTPMLEVLDKGQISLELEPEADFTSDPVAAFGVLQAQRHRSRGVTLGLFLGLMKYYRQSYHDLLGGTQFPEDDKTRYRTFIERFFDRVELGFCVEWASHGESEKLDELQTAGRLMTNEKNRYLTIFESLNDPVFYIDETGRMANFNHAAARLFGGIETPGRFYYSADEVTLTWPDEATQEELTRDRTELRFERALPTSRGERWFDAKIMPMLDVSEKFSGTVIILSDVTERRAAEDSLRASQAQVGRLLEQVRGDLASAHDLLGGIMDGSADPIAAVDADLRLVAVNKAYEDLAADLFGRTASLGMPLAEALPADPGTQEDSLKACRRALAGETANLTRTLGMDGKARHFDMTVSPIRDETGRVFGASIIHRDITERREGEIRLQRTVDALTRSNVELERFAYIASHDLQEPIRNLVTYSQLLGRRYDGTLDADGRQFLDFIAGGAKRMQHLVRDLLAYSRVSNKGQPFTPVDLAATLSMVRENLQTSIEESGATILASGLPTVAGDDVQLVELLQNLITNAIKFHRPGVPPEIRLTAKRDGKSWVVSIADNGIGIDADYADHVFVIFKRLHTEQVYPGTGIGLALCKRIVERHGGRIWVDPGPSDGCVFRFTLPSPDSPPPSEPETA